MHQNFQSTPQPYRPTSPPLSAKAASVEQRQRALVYASVPLGNGASTQSLPPPPSIEVEVRLTDGGYYPAFVQAVDSEFATVTVAFLDKYVRVCVHGRFAFSWQSPQSVPLSACRLPPVRYMPLSTSDDSLVALPPLTPPEFVCVGDMVEAYCRSSANAFAAAWHLAYVVSTFDRRACMIKLITRDMERVQVRLCFSRRFDACTLVRCTSTTCGL
jgi:hypothetical protein